MGLSAASLRLLAFVIATIALSLSQASWAAAFAPSTIRSFTVLSSLNYPTGKGSQNRPLTKPFSTADASSAASSPAVVSEPVIPAPPSSSSNAENDTTTTNPYKVYELPSTTPPLIHIPAAASVFVATMGTFILNNYLNLGPVQASSVAGLVATLVLPEKLALAALCGSFAGMAKLTVIPGGILASGVLGLFCAAVLALLDHKKWLVGMGGRLGFAAQCACTTQYILTSSLSLLMGAAAETGTTTTTAAAALVGKVASWKTVALQLPQVTAFTVLGALFMKYWKDFFAQKTQLPRLSNSVAAVGATGLLSTLLLPASLAGPVFCGSFVAMSAPTKLPSVMALIGASSLAGISQQAMAGVMLGGWGGKLGTAAFLGVLSYTTLLSKLNVTVENASSPTAVSAAAEATTSSSSSASAVAPPITDALQAHTTEQEELLAAVAVSEGQNKEPELQDELSNDSERTTTSTTTTNTTTTSSTDSSSTEEEMKAQQEEAGFSENLKQNYL